MYEDKHLIFAVKPVGVLSQKGDGENMVDLLSQVRGQVYPVHRLDRAVGGVMVFAKTSDCAAKLSATVSRNEMVKEYVAVLCGIPEDESGILKDLLFKDSSKNKSFVVKRQRKGVKEASLEYRLLSTADNLSLVKIKLHTGRTHQIRVHMSYIGHPVAGDEVYGPRKVITKLGGQCLHAKKIGFVHPVSGEYMEFDSELPDYFKDFLEDCKNNGTV